MKAKFLGVLGALLPAVFLGQSIERPALVVGIVVDQMRQDYIYRFYEQFGEGGFKRLINEGFMHQNCHYSFMATYTGPGHASIYTGTSPMVNGIVANNWFDKYTGRTVYCAEDNTVRAVGTETRDGRMSPRMLLTTSIADELRLSLGMQPKVIGIALKDRGAILPAGFTANAAYWLAGDNWITSSYYMQELPKWVEGFNKKKHIDKYLKQDWTLMQPLERYALPFPDNNPWEGKWVGEETSGFPHKLSQLRDKNRGPELIKATPWGNSLTVDFALAALENEQLGQRGTTDMLCLSFSSPDYIGHMFGTYSLEVADNYVRLDAELARLFTELDTRVGKGKYLVFLTSDHGAANIPGQMKDLNIPGGLEQNLEVMDYMEEFLKKEYLLGREVILNFSSYNIFFNDSLLQSAGIDKKAMTTALALHLRLHNEIYDAIPAHQLPYLNTNSRPYAQLFKGVHPGRSGDIHIIPQTGWMDGYGRATGTTHGGPYAHDTHVPLLWYGWNIPQGKTATYCEVSDIASTLAVMLQISFPNGNTGQPLNEQLKP